MSGSSTDREVVGGDRRGRVAPLVHNAVAELVGHCRLVLLRPSLPIGDDEGLARVMEIARQDLEHHDAILRHVLRQRTSGGRDVQRLLQQVLASSFSRPPAASQPAETRLIEVAQAKGLTIRRYQRIVEQTRNRDPRLYGLVSQILRDEVEHQTWLLARLGREPAPAQRSAGGVLDSASRSP